MKAAFRAEAVGFGTNDLWELCRRRYGWTSNPSDRPWVAEITGRDDRYGYARVFIQEKRDYRESNNKATRGVWFWWTLETGRIYETRYRTTWNGGFQRRFLRVTDDGAVEDMSREEVETWLVKTSESTS